MADCSFERAPLLVTNRAAEASALAHQVDSAPVRRAMQVDISLTPR